MRCSRTEAPSLHRRYPASSVLRASPPPCRPGLTLAGCRLTRASPPAGLPVLRPFPSSTRAAATTPADPAGARVARFPTVGSLPRYADGSASALPVSRPARRSLLLRPAWSLSRPRRPVSECFERCRYLHHPLRLLPAGATVCRAGFAPAEERRLVTAHYAQRAADESSTAPAGWSERTSRAGNGRRCRCFPGNRRRRSAGRRSRTSRASGGRGAGG